MAVEVVSYDEEWPRQFRHAARDLQDALRGVASARVEHVGSTAVPGLAAKPVIDIDIVVQSAEVSLAIAALGTIGYTPRGDLGVAGREALKAPDRAPHRHVYVCAAGTMALRNHIAVRDVLRQRSDLRDEYAAVKRELVADAFMDAMTYTAGKSDVLYRVLAESDLVTAEERLQIRALNTSLAPPDWR